MPYQASAEVRNDEGYALLAVVILGILIGTVSLLISATSVHLAAKSARLLEAVEATNSLEAGLNRMIAAYVTIGDPLRETLASDGRSIVWHFNERALRLSVTAESGKWDVNTGDLSQIKNLLSLLCRQDEACLQIGPRIEEYRAGGRRIQSLLEVLLPIQRMSSHREMIEGHFTTLTAQRGIDPRTAPQAELEAIPGFPRELKETIANARERGTSVPMTAIQPVSGVSFVEERPIYTMHVVTDTGFVERASVTAIVAFSETGEAYVIAKHRTSIGP